MPPPPRCTMNDISLLRLKVCYWFFSSIWFKLKETTCPAGQINSDQPKSVIRHVRTTEASESAQMQGMSTAIHQPGLSLSTVQSWGKDGTAVKYPSSQGSAKSWHFKHPPSQGTSGSQPVKYPPSQGTAESLNFNYPPSLGTAGSQPVKYSPSHGTAVKYPPLQELLEATLSNILYYKELLLSILHLKGIVQ